MLQSHFNIFECDTRIIANRRSIIFRGGEERARCLIYYESREYKQTRKTDYLKYPRNCCENLYGKLWHSSL